LLSVIATACELRTTWCATVAVFRAWCTSKASRPLLDEGQPDELRRDARILKYWLCYEHLDDDEKDWTWVVEHIAPSDKYLTHVLKTAMDVAPEPAEHDLNVLLWFKLVKLEINDCWDDHQQGGKPADGCSSSPPDVLQATMVSVQ
jgi:hypothetical protein